VGPRRIKKKKKRLLTHSYRGRKIWSRNPSSTTKKKKKGSRLLPHTSLSLSACRQKGQDKERGTAFLLLIIWHAREEGKRSGSWCEPAPNDWDDRAQEKPLKRPKPFHPFHFPEKKEEGRRVEEAGDHSSFLSVRSVATAEEMAPVIESELLILRTPWKEKEE